MGYFAVEILGSGGAFRTPRPGCQCPVCTGAREHGIPWSRTGPSVFVHGPDVLIDTPEDSLVQVDRGRFRDIRAGLYSHWHPDHTAGWRMWETRNWDSFNWPPRLKTTPIYLPPRVEETFHDHMGLSGNFKYMQERGWVEVRTMREPVALNGWRISPIQLQEEYVYAYLFEEVEGSRRGLVVMDEMVGWLPPQELAGVELAVLPMGLWEFDEFSEERKIPVDHPVLLSEATYRQTLEVAERLAPKRLVFMHIEEPYGVTPPEFDRLAAQLRERRGWDVFFAHDTMLVEMPDNPVSDGTDGSGPPA